MALPKFQGNFNKEVMGKKGYVVVKFMATWCGPCKLLSPIVEDISKEMKTASFIEIDVDEHGDIAAQNSVMGVPAVIVFKDGKETGRISGYYPKEEFKKRLNAVM